MNSAQEVAFACFFSMCFGRKNIMESINSKLFFFVSNLCFIYCFFCYQTGCINVLFIVFFVIKQVVFVFYLLFFFVIKQVTFVFYLKCKHNFVTKCPLSLCFPGSLLLGSCYFADVLFFGLEKKIVLV